MNVAATSNRLLPRHDARRGALAAVCKSMARQRGLRAFIAPSPGHPPDPVR